MKVIFPELKSRKQTLVYKELFGEEFPDAHSAIGDLKAMMRICEEERVKNLIMQTFTRYVHTGRWL